MFMTKYGGEVEDECTSSSSSDDEKKEVVIPGMAEHAIDGLDWV